MMAEHVPSLEEYQKKIALMKRDQREYKAEAFIEIYEEYIERLEKEIGIYQT